MHKSLFLRVTLPWLVLGTIICGLCWTGAWYMYRMQRQLSTLLSTDVASLLAAQELEIRVRQLRYHCFLYLTEPSPERLAPITVDEAAFEAALKAAERNVVKPEEGRVLREIADGFHHYREELDELRRTAVATPNGLNPARVADAHPIRHVVDPCHELFRINQETTSAAAESVSSSSTQVRWLMIGLGLAGPLGGVLAGYGVARGISKTFYRLSVRIKDVAGRLDQDVATVSLSTGADLPALDAHLQRIVERVEEVGERLQQQQRELVRAEQLISAGRLAASVAHEVRNPLSAIKMLVEAAQRTSNATRLSAEDLEVILASVSRLEKTVDNFLQFARLPRPERRDCDLREVVTQALNLVRTRARHQDVTIHDPLKGAAVHAFADPGQVTTVLLNLFLNALDAMPSGGDLSVELQREPVSRAAVISVRDTGKGIPPEFEQRLFTPFLSSKETGTGLGLSIAKQIVEDHGGSLEGRNIPHGGAEFILRLPISKAQG